MRVLIVGAGAVGLVYGYALQQAGVEVGFYVRPKYAEAARQGFRLYDLNSRTPSQPLMLRDVAICTSPVEVSQQSWDYVMPAVSAPALEGDWLGELLAAAPSAHVVMLHAGAVGARAAVEAARQDHRLILGMIPFMSYAAPLPGETLEPGTAWWMPPGMACPFEGDEDIVMPLVEALRRGGLPARRQRGVVAGGAFGSAVLTCHVLALELSGWSFDALGSGEWGRVASAATREAAAISSTITGLRVPLWISLVNPWTMKVVMSLARWLTPHDVEAFFEVHFSKVGAQSRDHVRRWIAVGQERGHPTAALGALSDALGVSAMDRGAQ